MFTKEPEDVGPPKLEERKDHHFRRIYVLENTDGSTVWTRSRTWAMLEAYERHPKPFVEHDEEGLVRMALGAVVHLPLPFGRLCALLGRGMPGPVTKGGEVVDYVYPFGPVLWQLLRDHIPDRWLA